MSELNSINKVPEKGDKGVGTLPPVLEDPDIGRPGQSDSAVSVGGEVLLTASDPDAIAGIQEADPFRLSDFGQDLIDPVA